MNRGDLADLSAFVAVADRLSFSAAASQLGVTPRLSAIRCGSWKSALAYACCTYDAQRVADRRRPALARSVAAGNRRIHFFSCNSFHTATTISDLLGRAGESGSLQRPIGGDGSIAAPRPVSTSAASCCRH